MVMGWINKLENSKKMFPPKYISKIKTVVDYRRINRVLSFHQFCV